MKTRLLIIFAIGIIGFTGITFAEELKTFVIDGYAITTNSKYVTDIFLDWNSEYL